MVVRMEPTSPTIIVAEPLDTAAVCRLRNVGRVRELESPSESALVAAMSECDALIVRSRCSVTRRVIQNAPRLRVIGRGGVGLEHIDIEAAKSRGIQVVYTPEASTNAVAELTVGLMLALERRLVAADAMVRDGRFAEARVSLVGRELAGLTLGIVGMGRIGQRVAHICSTGLAMTIIYNDIRELSGLAMRAQPREKEALYAESDIVTLHVPLTETACGMIDARALAMFKPSATLINTSRGQVVDGSALACALATGQLAGAALDVFDPEPPELGDSLLTASNTLFSSHLGARTATSLSRMNDVVGDVIAVLEGRLPRYAAW